MGGDGGKGGDSIRNYYGNQSSSNDLSSLFGGNRTFNLGAGSSSFDIKTNSVDLSSFLKDSSTNTAGAGGAGGEGGGFDVAASVGVGVGGGSGSGGQVDKNTQNPFSFMPSVGGGSGSNDKLPLYLAIGGTLLGVILIIATRRR